MVIDITTFEPVRAGSTTYVSVKPTHYQLLDARGNRLGDFDTRSEARTALKARRKSFPGRKFSVAAVRKFRGQNVTQGWRSA